MQYNCELMPQICGEFWWFFKWSAVIFSLLFSYRPANNITHTMVSLRSLLVMVIICHRYVSLCCSYHVEKSNLADIWIWLDFRCSLSECGIWWTITVYPSIAYLCITCLLQTLVACNVAFSALKLLVGHQEEHLTCKKIVWWGAGMVICLERGANHLHIVQLMPLPLRSCLLC